ncbi:MAG: hypothetical protein AMXMBFR61_09540 [Fimbriimonadales bacterium]
MLTIIALAFVTSAQAPRIHSVTDISHEFTFYMDGRFHSQYIGENGIDVRNWGSLWKQDLGNANLLILSSGQTRVDYDERTIAHVRAFAQDGGGVVILSDQTGSEPVSIQKLAKAFGAEFLAERAQQPLTADESLAADKVEFYGGGVLRLGPGWKTLVRDAAGKPVLARRMYGKGHVLVGIRGLFGNRPDASDPINAIWVKPLLLDLARGKKVDLARPPQGQFAELTQQVGPLTVEFSEGMKPFADMITKEYLEVRPHLVAITGVEPSPGMIGRLLLLPTGGGGFSSGERIAIGAWWGDYPKNRYPMIELIGHEAGHSWVLPYAEPVWNEPIATYLGIQVGRRMGMPEADETLKKTIERARAKDPDFTAIDIKKPDAPTEVIWGKTFYIFEELEAKYGPGVIAKYFREKRQTLKPGRSGYSLDDCVAVWSRAVGEDLFPWFRSLGISVSAEATDIPISKKS